jgi:hypothetical protein
MKIIYKHQLAHTWPARASSSLIYMFFSVFEHIFTFCSVPSCLSCCSLVSFDIDIDHNLMRDKNTSHSLLNVDTITCLKFYLKVWLDFHLWLWSNIDNINFGECMALTQLSLAVIKTNYIWLAEERIFLNLQTKSSD